MVQQHQIKAIETVYKGYRFRSRLEARWAVFFDALGVKWEYEKEGFELNDGLRYLPDFWLPRLSCWVEVKPDAELSVDESEKLCAFGTDSSDPIYLCRGLPGQFKMTRLWKGQGTDDFMWWQCLGCFAVMPGHKTDSKSDHLARHALCFAQCMLEHPQIFDGSATHEAITFFRVFEMGDIKDAFNTARGARFEFGENGGAR